MKKPCNRQQQMTPPLPLSNTVEPTKIIVPPLSLDATVGQSLVLPCEVASDSSQNPNFKWFFNGKAIDFNRQEHFEMIGVVSIIWVNTLWSQAKKKSVPKSWYM